MLLHSMSVVQVVHTIVCLKQPACMLYCTANLHICHIMSLPCCRLYSDHTLAVNWALPTLHRAVLEHLGKLHQLRLSSTTYV